MDSDPAAEADRWFESEMRAADDLARFSESVAATLFASDIKTYIHSEKIVNRYNPNIDVNSRVRQHMLHKDRRQSAISGIAGSVAMLLLDGGLPDEIVEDIQSIIIGVLNSERNRRMVRTLPDDSIDGAASVTEQIITLPPF